MNIRIWATTITTLPIIVMLALTGCGGGGGGPSGLVSDPPQRPAVSVPSPIDYSRTNTNATDLLDVWNDPASFLSASGFSLEPATEHAARRAQFREALAGGEQR